MKLNLPVANAVKRVNDTKKELNNVITIIC